MDSKAKMFMQSKLLKILVWGIFKKWNFPVLLSSLKLKLAKH